SGFEPCQILPNALLEPHAADTPRPLRCRNLLSDLTWDDPAEMWTYNFLRTKRFHEVSAASPHVYSLKSRYGKVRLPLQRHFNVLPKFAHVESRFCGRKGRGKSAFDVPINPCVRSICSQSVAVGLLPLHMRLHTSQSFSDSPTSRADLWPSRPRHSPNHWINSHTTKRTLTSPW